MCECVSKKDGTREEKQSVYNRLTFFGHITNLFIYFTILLQWASALPEEGAHSKAILIRQNTFLLCLLSYFLFYFVSSLSHFLQIKDVFKEQSLFLLLETFRTNKYLVEYFFKQIKTCWYAYKYTCNMCTWLPYVLHVPCKVLFVFPLLPCQPGLGHICPVREGLEQTTDVLILGPGGTNCQLLLTLDDTPEDTKIQIQTISN